jgi:hypothetical protein
MLVACQPIGTLNLGESVRANETHLSSSHLQLRHHASCNYSDFMRYDLAKRDFITRRKAPNNAKPSMLLQTTPPRAVQWSRNSCESRQPIRNVCSHYTRGILSYIFALPKLASVP